MINDSKTKTKNKNKKQIIPIAINRKQYYVIAQLLVLKYFYLFSLYFILKFYLYLLISSTIVSSINK
jgi:hypothetical protein